MQNVLGIYELQYEGGGKEVLKEGELLPSLKTLKDKDFMKLEKEIQITKFQKKLFIS